MTVPAIGALSGVPRIQPIMADGITGVSGTDGLTGTNGLTGTDAATGTGAAGATGGTGFADLLGAGVDGLQATQTKADDLAVKAATGDLTDVHDYMIASTRADLATQLTTAVRNRAVEAFQEIMRMQG